jgi:hypothetical protein
MYTLIFATVDSFFVSRRLINFRVQRLWAGPQVGVGFCSYQYVEIACVGVPGLRSCCNVYLWGLGLNQSLPCPSEDYVDCYLHSNYAPSLYN